MFGQSPARNNEMRTDVASSIGPRRGEDEVLDTNAEERGELEITDNPARMKVVTTPEVRRFIATRGGDLYVWISVHGWGFFRTVLMEAATEPPAKPGLFFRRRRVRGFNLQLEADRRWWPKTLELDICGRGKKVCAYWNGQAWVG
jgi:hypothetical protein